MAEPSNAWQRVDCEPRLGCTRGERGTRGTAEERGREAAGAVNRWCRMARLAPDISDGAIENTLENRIKIVRVLRQSSSGAW